MYGKTAELVKKYIDEKGIKQEYIVNKTSFSSTTLSDTLNNKRRLLADEFVEIVLALEVDANYFIDQVNKYFEK